MLFRLSAFSIATFVLFLTLSANAATLEINHSVPIAQGYVSLTPKQKDQSTNFATIVLTLKDPAAVTFSTRAMKTGSVWGDYQSGVVVKETYVTYQIPYEYNLGVGTFVQACFRSHNWSLNSNQIEGTLNYY